LTVDPLGERLCEWLGARAADPKVEWPYHPRSNDFSDFVRRTFLHDLLGRSTAAKAMATTGKLVCDLNVSLVSQTSGRKKKIDLVVGRPLKTGVRSSDLIEKAKVASPLLTLEVKACMTEHGKAAPRLIDELLSSLEVVRGADDDAVPIAVLVVNAADRFTSPLNLPGPNVHQQPDATQKLLEHVRERVKVGPQGYSAFAITIVSFDNEKTAEPLNPLDWVPKDRTYDRALQIAATGLEGALKKRA